MRCLWVALGIVAVLSAPAFSVQGFSSGSTGADGALDFSSTPANTTIVFDPSTFTPPLDADGDNVYHFTTITIPKDVTVRLGADKLGTRPVVWLASGAVQIKGTLDLNGAPGHPFNALAIPAGAGAGGYGGGAGPATGRAAQAGDGPGGGKVLVTSSGGGGAGHAVAGGGGTNVGGAAYGNDFLLPLLGGSGGAGAPNGGNGPEAGGGAGGGALLIASSVSITIDGTITANGGSGGNVFSRAPGNGSGGAIRLMAPIIAGAGTLSATGGSGGNTGSYGRIRLEASQRSLTGTVTPAPSVASPGLVFLPANGPSLRIKSVAGAAVPGNTVGSFAMADLRIENVSTATIELEARNIPTGTVVQLTLTPESGTAVTVQTTPLTGTAGLSTATASVTLPYGFSRFFAQATWTPPAAP